MIKNHGRRSATLHDSMMAPRSAVRGAAAHRPPPRSARRHSAPVDRCRRRSRSPTRAVRYEQPRHASVRRVRPPEAENTAIIARCSRSRRTSTRSSSPLPITCTRRIASHGDGSRQARLLAEAPVLVGEEARRPGQEGQVSQEWSPRWAPGATLDDAGWIRIHRQRRIARVREVQRLDQSARSATGPQGVRARPPVDEPTNAAVVWNRPPSVRASPPQPRRQLSKPAADLD